MAPELVDEFLKKKLIKALYRKATFIRVAFYLYLYRSEGYSLCLMLHSFVNTMRFSKEYFHRKKRDFR
jgi:hypothetical protein